MAKQAHHRQGVAHLPLPVEHRSRHGPQADLVLAVFDGAAPPADALQLLQSASARVTMVWGVKGSMPLTVHQIAHRGIRQLGQQQLPLRRGVKGRTAADLRGHLDPRCR